MSVLFPAFDIASIPAREGNELHNERSESARYNQVLQGLTGQMDKAHAVWMDAQRVSQSMPI